MGHHSEAFIGIDTAKLRNAVAIAEAGRRGEVRYLGEVDTSEAATRKLVAKLAAKYLGQVSHAVTRGPEVDGSRNCDRTRTGGLRVGNRPGVAPEPGIMRAPAASRIG